MQRSVTQPWGRLAGLLAGSGATFIGVLRDLNPDVILARALVSGVIVGAVTTMVVSLLASMAHEEE